MDHDATREQLELAAVEPGGIDRLIAGDTATAQAVAAHLAGCPDCADELARLQRASRLIRAVVREQPPADLRDRTLVRVRAMGRDRTARPGDVTAAPATAGAPVASAVRPAPADGPPTVSPSAPGRGVALGWAAAIAAAVVLSVATTSILVGGQVDQRLALQSDTIHTLEEVTTATLRVTSELDARHVDLTGASPSLTGTLAFSPSTSELVVVATGLTAPPAGQEYRCWIERNGQRQRVGKMFFSDDLAYWIGPVPAVKDLSGSAQFGVSLVNGSAPGADTAPILGGRL